MRKILLLPLGAFLILGLTAQSCENSGTTGQQRETAATNQLIDQASTSVGMPGMRNFTEKRQLRMLYELRDNADLITYTYYTDLNGGRHKICPKNSLGYGLPFSAQFTAPRRDIDRGQTTVTIEQPEPNGLYMPDSTSATWVICAVGDELEPVYVEPAIIVSPFELTSVD